MTAERPTEPEWERKRRLAAVFGEVLPDTTTDDLPDATPEATETTSDEWLRAQVPPHHG